MKHFINPTIGIGAGFALNRTRDFYDSLSAYPWAAISEIFMDEITRTENLAQRTNLFSPMGIVYVGFDFCNKKGRKLFEVGCQFNKGFGSLINMKATGQSGTVAQGYIENYNYEAVSRGTTLAIYAAVPIRIFRWGVDTRKTRTPGL